MYNWSGTVPGWTATTMDNLYVHCQLAINRFSSREKNFVTHKQQCLQAVDCNDIRFQDGKRIHTLGAQSVHTRWILKLKPPCELLHFMRQVTAVACCFCICFAETRIQIYQMMCNLWLKFLGWIIGCQVGIIFFQYPSILGLFVLGKQYHLPLAGIRIFC